MNRFPANPVAGNLLSRSLLAPWHFFSDPKGGKKHADGGRMREYGFLDISEATLSPRGTSDKASSHAGQHDEPAYQKERNALLE